jgi:diguanylate cyclase (GGDEF)-like protein/putative nucleotidyltransferase with HDIG domain
VFLFSCPVVICTLVFTNQWHHLFYTKLVMGERVGHGPLFTPCLIWTYLILLSGYITSIRHVLKTDRDIVKKLFMFSQFPVVPAIGVLARSLSGIDRVDYTPIVMAIAMISLYQIIFGYHYVNIISASVREVIEQTAHPISLYSPDKAAMTWLNRAARDRADASADMVSHIGSEKRTFELLHVEFILPILADGELIGLTLLSPKQNKKPYAYSEISFLESVTAIVSIAIKNAELYETIQEEARLDSLTNVYNRRYFTSTFEKLFEEHKQANITLVLLNFDDFKLYNELYGADDGDRILVRFADILKEVIGSHGIVGRYSGKEFSVCLPMCSSAQAERLVEEIRARLDRVLNDADERTKRFLTFSAGICTYPASAANAAQLFTYANMAVYAGKKSGKNRTVVYSQKHQSETSALSFANMEALAQEYAPTIYALTAAIDAKDHYTFNHSKNVSYLATQLARAIGLDNEHVEMIRQAGLLHDIGKISIPEAILAKTSRLTAEEYETMKSHVENSISMIRHLPSLDYVIPIAISHHERYDGGGYPRGLAGENIPVGGRCLGIADAFDAIVSRRPYKDPVPIPDALKEIERNLGRQFDPELGRIFIDLVQNGTIRTDIYTS